MRTGVVAKRCSCGSFWRNRAPRCRRCGSTRFASWGFYVDTHPRGATEHRKTVRSGFPTKDAAERELLRVLEAVQAGAYGAPSKQTLQGYLGAWLEAKTHLRPTTRDTYSILIERYICDGDYGIGTAPLWSLTRPGIKHFYAELERRGRMRGDRPLHPKAVHNVHLVLRKALEDAVDDGLILENPARRAHKLSVHRPEMKTWTEDQVASFLAHVRGHRLYALWRTAATTGMRRGELLAVTWPALDLTVGRLHVTRALAKGPAGEPPRFGPPKTDRGRRAVPLDPETVSVLKDHRRRQLAERETTGETWRDYGLVFCRRDGRPLDPDWTTHIFHPGLLPARRALFGRGRDRSVCRARGRMQGRVDGCCGYQTGIRAAFENEVGPSRSRRAPTSTCAFASSRGQDLNLRPLGYEPSELPDCSTPQAHASNRARSRQ